MEKEWSQGGVCHFRLLWQRSPDGAARHSVLAAREEGRLKSRGWQIPNLVRIHFLFPRWASAHCVLAWRKDQELLEGLPYKGANRTHEGPTLMT